MFAGLAKIYFMCFFFLMMVIFLLRIKLSKGLLITLNVLFIVSVWIISYNFIPDNTMDLSRYKAMLDSIRGLPYNVIREVGPYKDTLVANWYFSVMTKIEDFSLFSAIPTTVSFILTYLSGMWILKKSQSSYYNYALYFILIISASTFLGIVSGIRQNFSWTLILLAVNLDFFGEKKNKWLSFLIYFLAIMVHDGAVVLLFIRFLLTIMNKVKYSWLIYLIWPLSLGFVNRFNHILPISLQETFAKLQLYVLNDAATNNIRLISIFIMYMGFLTISIYLYRNNEQLKFINSDFLLFFINIAVFGLVSIFAPHLYSRIFTSLTILSLPIIVEYTQSKHSIKLLILTLIMLIGLMLFIYQDMYVSPIFIK